MTITIPIWLLWVLGVAGALVLLGLAALGVLFIYTFKDGPGVPDVSAWQLRCDDCGRFISEPGSWADIYDMVGLCLDHQHVRCAGCTATLGPARSNARPADGNLALYEGTAQ